MYDGHFWIGKKEDQDSGFLFVFIVVLFLFGWLVRWFGLFFSLFLYSENYLLSQKQ